MPNFIPSCIPSADVPSFTLKWLKEKAAPKMAVKLMKCHRYFQYPEFPFHVATELGTYYSSNKWFYHALDEREHIHEEMESVDNLKKKLWIIGGIHFFNSLLSPALIQKIAVCDVSYLELQSQSLSFAEFKILTASGTVDEARLHDTTITFENGDPVYFGDIVKCIPNAKHFQYHNGESPIFGADMISTFKDIDASNLRKIEVQMASFASFLLFLKFMEHNPRIQYRLEFITGSISVEETKALEKYVQNIIDAGFTKYMPPDISFPGQTPKQYCTLMALIWKYYKFP